MITKKISFSMMAQRLSNLGSFSSELESVFLEGGRDLYNDGKTASLSTQRLPSKIKMILNYKDPMAYYLPFIEWGTGEHMPSWWNPHREKGAAIANFRRKPRNGKAIKPRGRGNPWIDLAHRRRQGKNTLFFNGHYYSRSSGQPGKHRLKWYIETYFSNSLNNLAMQKAFQKIEKGSYV